MESWKKRTWSSVCIDHTSYGIRLIKYSENIVNVVSDVKRSSARGRALIKGHITSVILSQRGRQGEAGDPGQLCAVTHDPTGWQSKEKQGGGGGGGRTPCRALVFSRGRGKPSPKKNLRQEAVLEEGEEKATLTCLGIPIKKQNCSSVL